VDFQEEDLTFFDFLETHVGGSGPPEPHETNPPLYSIPYPRLNFNFGGNMAANQPWLTISTLSIPGPQNPLPKHPKRLLPKFDPNKVILPKDHIMQFMLTLSLMNVQHEDVVCMSFFFTLQGKASSWFFSLAPRSIISWQLFETNFITQFRDDKTSSTLFLEISSIRIKYKELKNEIMNLKRSKREGKKPIKNKN
jgi:hypothetical protein